MKRARLAVWLVLTALTSCFYNDRDSYACKVDTDCPIGAAYTCDDGQCERLDAGNQPAR